MRALQQKFAHAMRGARVAMAGGNGFALHGLAAVVVVAIAWWLDCSTAEWLVLILCITGVIVAELFNTAIEHLARAVTQDEHPEIRNALDISAAAVLVTAVGAKLVWVVVLASLLLS